ncbi:MAG: UDP-N-acetylmuramoyl-L-alanine--D-glutamate ligase [Clostridiales bacterium]|nr:UDP-N-acetylmuramoyl-L-alanine--D-glutamate ligase [Clostridiales bacterium]
MDFQGREVLVMGAGLSGVAACRFLLKRGAKVTLADCKQRQNLSLAAQALLKAGVKFWQQRYVPSRLPWSLCIKSPGVPGNILLLQVLRCAGIPIWGELELAYRFAQAPFIAITGTNGKTTTTALLGYILQRAGFKVLVAGNIGDPLIGHMEEYYDYIVAEVSSFQLEDTELFHAAGALFLNLSPDHLNRHGDMGNYLAAKARVFRRQKTADFAVVNVDDEAALSLLDSIDSRKLCFSLKQAVAQGAFLAQGYIYIGDNGRHIPVMAAKDIYIKGRHNWGNALAAIAAAHALAVDSALMADCLATFPGVEHRLEFVVEKAGVTYINDSKGTNPDSTEKALLAYEQPLVLIAGGYDKKADFLPLMGLIKERVKHLVVLGQTAGALLSAAGQLGYSAVSRAGSFEEAVLKAQALASPGDIVLLSPACASYDMFENFEARGHKFKEICLGGECS